MEKSQINFNETINAEKQKDDYSSKQKELEKGKLQAEQVETIQEVVETGVISEAEFAKLGFEKENSLFYINNIPSISVKKIEDRLSLLKSLGFNNIDRIAESYPYQVLGSRNEDIENTMNILKTDIGIDNPAEALSRQPQLIFVSRDKILRRFSFLKEIGFADSAKMVRKYPGILGFTSESLISKIGFLKDVGISKPLEVVEVSPDILTMSKSSLEKKIESLKETFPNLDVSDLIMKFKKILTYNPDKLAKNKELIDRIINLHHANISSEELVLYFPQILSYSSDRLILVARIMSEYEISVDDIKKTIVGLVANDIESVMAAFVESQKNKDKNIHNLMKKIGEVKKSDITKEEKRSVIDRDLSKEKVRSKYNKLSQKKTNKVSGGIADQGKS